MHKQYPIFFKPSIIVYFYILVFLHIKFIFLYNTVAADPVSYFVF